MAKSTDTKDTTTSAPQRPSNTGSPAARPAASSTDRKPSSDVARAAATSSSHGHKAHRDERAPVSEKEANDARINAAPVVSRGITGPIPKPAKSSGFGTVIEDTFEEQTRAARNRPARIKVQATQMGYFDHIRRRAGDVFTIPGDTYEEDQVVTDATTGRDRTMHRAGEVQAFSTRWMRRVSGSTPERITTGKEDLARQHDELLSSKMGGTRPEPDGGTRSDDPTGAGNVIGD